MPDSLSAVLILAGTLLSASAQQPRQIGNAGDVTTNPKDGQRYAWIPPGTFTMGCSLGDAGCDGNEKPAHQVTITKGFWLGQTEVTVGAYKRFVSTVGDSMPPESTWLDRSLNPGWQNEQLPIVNVTWDEARSFCGWAGGRLPTEAEWEYAARSGSPGARYGELDSVAWYADNSGNKPMNSTEAKKSDPKGHGNRLYQNGNEPHPVGQKLGNAWRLYDVLGNLWEWTTDSYEAEYYANAETKDPQRSSATEFRVLRGGSWGDDPRLVRVSVRGKAPTGHRSNSIGARCVWSKP